MSISKWYNDTLTIYRQETITDGNGNVVGTKEAEEDEITGDLQQMTPEKAETMNLSFRNSFVFRTATNTDIKEGDIAKDTDGNEYGVVGVKELSHSKMKNNHLEVILRK